MSRLRRGNGRRRSGAPQWARQTAAASCPPRKSAARTVTGALALAQTCSRPEGTELKPPVPQAQITFQFVWTSLTTFFGPHLHYITIESADGPRGALRYGDGALPTSLTPPSCRLHPGASPPAPLVCPAGAPTGISGIRVRAARARCHAPRPAFKSLTVDGPVAYPTVSHKLYTPCPNGRRDVAKRLSHAGG